MTKSLLYRLFRVGKIPDQLKPQIENEGILFQDEGIPGSITYINFRSPRRYASWRRVWYSGSITVTQSRFLALAYSRPAINVPFADPRFRSMAFSLTKASTLLIAFDASLFHSDWSGNVEYRYSTPQAQAILDALKMRQA